MSKYVAAFKYTDGSNDIEFCPVVKFVKIEGTTLYVACVATNAGTLIPVSADDFTERGYSYFGLKRKSELTKEEKRNLACTLI